ncbi:MAG: chemotaxis protein CheW [Sandaracinaceae bacterium]|nr:chemotaxis protein CheW [Sandaracinaceae bacterium]
MATRPLPDRSRQAPAVPERKLVLFGVGTVVYGLPIERVREVVNPLEIIPLPHAPPSVVGVTDHRGEVVPVVDLRSRFDLPPVDGAEAHRRRKWIMVDVGEPGAPRPIAAVVDAVHSVHLSRDPLRPAPPLGAGEDTRGIVGVLGTSKDASGEGGLIFVLDLGRLRALVEPLGRSG